MQGALIAQGYKCGSYGADGICGAATVAAIKACQRANGLTADGICGPDTLGRAAGQVILMATKLDGDRAVR